MKNILKIDHAHSAIIMDRTFAKNAENTMSAEYAHLQSVRRDYPNYTVARRQIKKNPNKECYKGLTYAYMEDYITSHESGENRKLVLKEFAELRLIAQCHSKAHRYPVIKQWFLDKYPEIATFGMSAAEDENEDEDVASSNSEKVVDLPQAQSSEKLSA